MPIVAMEYIEINDRGVAKIIGSRSKVRQIVMDVRNGLSPADIHEQYPHLSMAQIHAALAYYYDHTAEIDAEIEAGRRVADELQAAQRNNDHLTRAELERRWRERTGKDLPMHDTAGE